LRRSQWDVPIESIDGWLHIRDGDRFVWLRPGCHAKLVCPPPVVAYPWEAVFEEDVGEFSFRRVYLEDHWCEEEPPRTPSDWVSAWSEEWGCFFYEHVGTGRSFWELEVPLLQWHGLLPVGTVLNLGDIRKAFKRFCLKCHPDKEPGDEVASAFFTEMREVFGKVEAALSSIGRSAGPCFEPVWDLAEASFGLRRISNGEVVDMLRQILATLMKEMLAVGVVEVRVRLGCAGAGRRMCWLYARALSRGGGLLPRRWRSCRSVYS